jgi:hypothetical protein
MEEQNITLPQEDSWGSLAYGLLKTGAKTLSKAAKEEAKKIAPQLAQDILQTGWEHVKNGDYKGALGEVSKKFMEGSVNLTDAVVKKVT